MNLEEYKNMRRGGNTSSSVVPASYSKYRQKVKTSISDPDIEGPSLFSGEPMRVQEPVKYQEPVQSRVPSPTQYQTTASIHPEPAVLAAYKPLTQEDTQKRFKTLQEAHEKSLRDLDLKYKEEVAMKRLYEADQILKQRTQAKAPTIETAKQQLLTEQGKAKVLANPQDEQAWLQLIANSRPWQELNLYQTNPDFAKNLKERLYQELFAEDAAARGVSSMDVKIQQEAVMPEGALRDAEVALRGWGERQKATANTMGALIGNPLAAGQAQMTMSNPLMAAGMALGSGTSFGQQMEQNTQEARQTSEAIRAQAPEFLQKGAEQFNNAGLMREAQVGDKGGASKFWYDLVGVVPDMLSTAALAAMTGGGAAAGQMTIREAGKALLKKETAKKAMASLAQKLIVNPETIPMALNIFSQDYQSNLAEGMDEGKALFNAFINSYGQTLLEGGGINQAFREGGKRQAAAWLKSMAGEGWEEVTQSWWEGAVDKLIAGKDMTILPGTEGKDSIINPKEDLRSAAIGAIAAGAPVAVNAVANAPAFIKEKTTPTYTAETVTRQEAVPEKVVTGQPQTVQSGTDKANPDMVAEKDRAAKQAELDKTFGALGQDAEKQKVYNELFPKDEPLAEAPKSAVKEAIGQVLPEIQKIIEPVRKEAFSKAYVDWDTAVNQFDERGSTPEQRKAFRDSIKPQLDAYVSAETDMNSDLTIDAVYDLMVSGAAPKQVYDLVQQKSVAKATKTPNTGTDVKVTPKTVIPGKEQVTETVIKADTSKMAPGFRAKLEADYATAQEFEPEIMRLAKQGKTRSEIVSMLDIPPAQVRAVLRMNAVPDVKSPGGRVWVYQQQLREEVGAVEQDVRNAEEVQKTEKLITPEEASERLSAVMPGASVVETLLPGQVQAQKLGKRLGVDVVFYTGDRVPAGRYRGDFARTVFIREADSAAATMRVMGHEFYHSLRVNHNELFRGLRDVMRDGLTSEKASKLIDEFKNDPEYQQRVMEDPELLIEEMLADEAGSLFTDKTFWENVAKKDENLARRLVRLMREFISRVLDTPVGSWNKDYMSELQMKEFRAKFESAVADIIGAEGVEIDTASDSVAADYNSVRTWTKQDVDSAVADITKQLKIPEKKVKSWLKSLDNVAAQILADQDRLDYEAAEMHTALKDNSDPHYSKSLDFSTLCKKRLAMQGVMEAVQTNLGRGLLPKEFLEVRRVLLSKGIEVSCGICYVDSRRIEMGKIANKFIAEYPDLDPNLFLTQEGLDELKSKHNDIYKKFNGATGVRGIKAQESRTEYRGEIKKLSKAKVEDFNSRSGLRWQSWSDFEVPHLLDAMQAIVDMSSVGLRGHAYTKVPEFAEAFGQTGLMINLSLIPKGETGMTNGELVFDPVEGMDFATAKDLRTRFNKSVGTIAIGINDAQISALLASPEIDYVIPYHISGLSEENRAIAGQGIEKWSDYSSTQREEVLDWKVNEKFGGKWAEKAKNRKMAAPEISEWWDNKKTPLQNQKKYIAMCAEMGIRPKFEQFSQDPNYWKLLIDRRMVDSSGKNIVQEAPKPVFDDAYLNKILDEYSGGHRNLPVDQATVDVLTEAFSRDSARTQEFSSADTSINQVPGIHKKIPWVSGTRNVDYGGGKFDTASDFLREEHGVENIVIDPFNRSEEHNKKAKADLSKNPADTGTVANVLNVIKEPEIRADVIRQASDMVKPGGTLYISVYEGDGSGVGKETSKGWQNNRKTADYLPEVQAVLPGAIRRGSVIEAPVNSSRMKAIEEAFKDSKVRNKDGSLKLLHHGTGALDITVFDKNRGGSRTHADSAKMAFFFTDSKSVAETYRDGTYDATAITNWVNNLTPAEMEAFGESEAANWMGAFEWDADADYKWTKQNIINFASEINQNEELDSYERFVKLVNKEFGEDVPKKKLWDEVVATYKKGYGTVMDVYLNMKNPLEVNVEDGFFERLYVDNLKKAKELGHDGVIFRNVDDAIQPMDSKDSLMSDVYAVFGPEQIKSPYSDNPVDLNDPDIRNAVRQTSGDNIQMDEIKEPKDWPGTFKNLYRRIVDKNAPIYEVSERAGMLASNSATAAAVVENIFTGYLSDRNGKKIGESLQKTLKGTDKDFWEYMAHLHNIDRAREGKNVIADSSSADSAVYVQQVEKTNPEYKAKAKEVVKWIDRFMMEWGVKAGVVDASSYADWRSLYPNYFPTQREFSDIEKGGGLGPGKRFVDLSPVSKKATGSDRKLANPVGNIMLMVNKVVRTAKYNEAGKALLDTIRANPNNPYAEEIPPSVGMFRRNLDNVVTVFENGQPSYLQINNQMLLESLKGLPKIINNLPRWRKVMNIYKGLITQYNPLFALRNIFRDIPTAYVYGSQDNPLMFLGNLVKAGYQIATGAEAAEQYKALGGTSSGQFSTDDAAKYATQLDPKSSVVKAILKAPLTVIKAFNELTEQAPRLAEFNYVLQQTGDIQRALYAAQTVTVNFSRGGDLTKQAEALVPYLNASVQGIDMFFRRMFNAKDIKGSLKRMAKAGIAISLPAVVEFILNSASPDDEDRYKSVNREVRDAFYLFPKGDGTYWRIPKSRELGVLFGALVERTLFGEGLKGFAEAAKTNFLPVDPLTNNLFAPLIWNLPMNQNFAGSKIVPQYMINDKRRPEDQWDDNTSEIAKKIGEITKLSPKQIDYILKSYSGVVGQFLLPATTDRSGAGTALERMTVGAFTTDPAFSSQALTDFYDRLDVLAQERTTKDLQDGKPSSVNTPEDRMYNRAVDIASLVSSATKYINTLKANDPQIREIKSLVNVYAGKAANAKTVAELVKIRAEMSAGLRNLGVR